MTTASVVASAVSATAPVAKAVRSHFDSKIEEDENSASVERVIASAAEQAAELAGELKEGIESKRNEDQQNDDTPSQS